MKRFKIIEPVHSPVFTNVSSHRVTLHENILDILFKHQGEVHKKLIDVQGTFLIDHIAIKIIDPNSKIIIFSISPSVEYNLIIHNIWQHDLSFSRDFQKLNDFYEWEKAYSKEHLQQLKFLKQQKHGFTYGFNISKIMGAYTFIYSYATRSENKNLHEFYFNNIAGLSGLGDYGFTLIRNIYKQYCCPDFELPNIPYTNNQSSKPTLKLIINNNEKGA